MALIGFILLPVQEHFFLLVDLVVITLLLQAAVEVVMTQAAVVAQADSKPLQHFLFRVLSQ
jgi:hypothetical protein